MKKDPSLVVANWKMNPITLKEAERLTRSLHQGIDNFKKKDFSSSIELIVCPPSVYLSQIPQNKYFELGVQNTHWETRGPFTGEISCKMAEDLGCKYTIIGHSERRKYFGETDETINLKLKETLKTQLRPVVCVGESKEEREKNQTTKVIKSQLEKIFEKISVLSLPKIVIAYEPVWAISSMNNNSKSVADDPNDVMGIAILIKKVLADLYRSDVIDKVRIIYGGSVNDKNVQGFLEMGVIGGFLIGGASLSAFEFLPILRKIYQVKAESKI